MYIMELAEIMNDQPNRYKLYTILLICKLKLYNLEFTFPKRIIT